MTRIPPCPHAKSCGGCSLQEMGYDEQVFHKEEHLKHLFGKDIHLHRAPSEFHYRSRMDFICSKGKIGLRQRGNARAVVDIKNCLLLSDQANGILDHVRNNLPQIDMYDLASHKGFLRYFTIRETSTKQFMLIFTTTTPTKEEEKLFIDFLHSLTHLAQSLVWLIQDSKMDDVGGSTKLVLGKSHLVEDILGLSFSLGPHTFFQSNHAVASKIFSEISSHVKDKILDLYCGVGVISLLTKAHTGVEFNTESIKSARENANNNNQETQFFAEDTAQFLLKARREKQTFDTIIVDPPRTGLGLNVVKAISLLKPKKLIYMSCNPKSFKIDAELLKKSFEQSSLEAYDMFPQTSHVELLSVFRKRKEL